MRVLLDKLRMAEWLLISLILLAVLAYTSPQQIPVLAYKALLVTFFAFLGYWIDRTLAPYGRPDCSIQSPDYKVDMLRRAIIVAAVVISGALAL